MPDQVEYVAQGRLAGGWALESIRFHAAEAFASRFVAAAIGLLAPKTMDTSSVNTSSEDETLTREIRIEVPHPKQIEFLRRMAPADRVAGALRMTRLLRTIATTRIRSAHPDWSDAQIAVALRERLHARRR